MKTGTRGMRHALLIVAAMAVVVRAQEFSELRQLYNAGKFKDVVGAAERAGSEAQRVQYLAAMSHEKLDNTAAARQLYEWLAENGGPAWAEVGRSALAAMDKRLDLALASANEAVERDESLPEAHFQRGLVLMLRREYGDAAGAFERASDLDATFASAFYYGGLAEYRAKRIDRMAAQFEAFLELAPDAPERGEVESIMRTVRGRN